MNNFDHIQSKLQQFIKKYYLNELIKGLILFSSFGFLYFIFTLFIEYFLWLKPLGRTILFWVFILVEFGLLTRFIIFPGFKLFGLQKGLSFEEASRLIGRHFSEIDDKLLNVLQLENSSQSSELLLASIEQKSHSLKSYSFRKAINFNQNLRYIKYLVIPVLIWIGVYITGNIDLFANSYDRVVHHREVYEPPPPFSFELDQDKLKVYENKDITIQFFVNGSVMPEEVQIEYLNQHYYVKNIGHGKFEYTFTNVQESLNFNFSANGFISSIYYLDMIPTPVITGFEMILDYPFYTNKKDEIIKNTGNAVVPQGTRITWKLEGKSTEEMIFKRDSMISFQTHDQVFYEHKLNVFNSFDYTISSSNKLVENYETLSYTIDVAKDAYPRIEVRSNIDSIVNGPANFYGQISDDYGVNRLQLVYFDSDDSSRSQSLELPIKTSSFDTFYYVFPEGIELEEGIFYEMYFEVFDNDGVNGSKSTKSNTFSYYSKTEEELFDGLLEEQQNTIDGLENSIEDSKENRENLKELQESLQNNSELNWNEQKQLDNFIKRQEQYNEMMEEQTDALERNLQDQPNSDNDELNTKKEEIEKRIDEAKELTKQEDLLKELQKLAEKLSKEELTEKLKELSEKNRQNDRSLERLLELTKRFYVEQKTNQIKDKIDALSKEQEVLQKSDDNTAEKQKHLNSKFESIKKELEQLDKDNKGLQKPIDLPKTEEDEEEISQDMLNAEDELKKSEKESNDTNKQKSKAKEKQKSAAKKMKEMSQKMQSSMQAMSGESMDEDIEMLRIILENLVEFSFQQEDLMEDFSSITNADPSFSKNLRRQQVLREYFEHIDDSLYTLSLRQPKIGSEIFKDLSKVHFHMEEALIHFADNKSNVGLSDQQFVMTSTNNIAALLSEILNGMQNASASMGSGKGGEESFSLPDIIKKQDDAIGKMEKGMKGDEGDKREGIEGDSENGENDPKKGRNGGKSEDGSEGENGDLFELYKSQAEIRRQLEEGLKDKLGEEGLRIGENALKQMEELEQNLLEKGFSSESLQRMMNLKHELLKLEEAAYRKGIDTKRESKPNGSSKSRGVIRDLDDEKLWFNENEILNRQSLPLRSNFKERVQYYFKVNDSIQ